MSKNSRRKRRQEKARKTLRKQLNQIRSAVKKMDLPVTVVAEAIKEVRKIDVPYFSKLGRIENENDHLGAQTFITNFLDNVIETFKTVDTEGVERMRGEPVSSEALRKDEIKPSLPIADVYANAPAYDIKYGFKLPFGIM